MSSKDLYKDHLTRTKIDRVKKQNFVRTVKNFYDTKGRHHLPWRKTKNVYKIVLSEIMLQQTQVDRVLPKYTEFLKLFPNIRALANASLGDVLRAWQGLGYNRRAKMLHQCAQNIVENYNGQFPKTYEALLKLPGIGPYTAGAVMAFAYNKPISIIETNIRTVYLHHFFNDKTDVSDKEVLALVTETLDEKCPREWYWALMDYGVHLKKTYGNPNFRSKSHVRQSKFEGSDRQVRGAILRTLMGGKCTRKSLLLALSQFEDIRVDAQLVKLYDENMIEKRGKSYRLPA